jgi:hypothetical protein
MEKHQLEGGGFVPILIRTVLATSLLSALAAIPGWPQQPSGASAREIFYAESDSQTKPDAAAQPPSKPPAKPPTKRAKAMQTTSTTQAGTKTTSSELHARSDSSGGSTTGGATTGGAKVVPVSQVVRPLGLRVSLLQMQPDGQAIEADPDTFFRAGDRLRVNVEVSGPGYLYIVNRGSSGTWTPLFPSPELPNLSNHVQPGVKYQVPQGAYFTVSDPPGAEKLFVILSPNPRLDMGALANDMSQQDKDGITKPGSKAPEAKEPPPPQMMAANLPSINDSMVDQMRETYTRDLIIEKVDDKTPGPKKETAVYAVNPSAGPNSKVVLDVRIQHK